MRYGEVVQLVLRVPVVLHRDALDAQALLHDVRVATVNAEDDGGVLSMVGSGLGMAIMPALSLAGAPPAVEITDLGPERPYRSVGCVTTPELATTTAVRALIRTLRSLGQPSPERTKAQLRAV
ncbi:LysR substrate-binding domain-containing protein [Streptomyces sp. IMTB 2501]|uniref:LysR substrate-binding domain-containing protein n=1 Tax=Streptomyces sp. IMTB 2501 TaxID=1776340 RepID=UPI003531F7C5